METAKTVLEKFGQDIVGALGKALPESKDATGELRNSIRFEVKQNGFTYSFKLYMEDYYKWVDEGRKPGGKQPPPDVLIKWIADKRLVFHKDAKGLDTKKQGDKRKEVAKSTQVKTLAFLMGRKIARFGIPATNFYTNTVTEEVIKQLKTDLTKALGKQIKIDILS